MLADKCHSVRNLLLSHIASLSSVEQVDDACVVTLPILTADSRLVDVFVETRAADCFLVHDGGKAMNELILQGINVTESVEGSFSKIAKQFNVLWNDEMFQSICKIDTLPAKVLAIGACSSMAMHHAIGHEATEAPEDSVRDQMGQVLRKWARDTATVREYVPAEGKIKQHSFDFVAYPKDRKIQPFSVSILSPGSASLATAERFGFKMNDLKGAAAAKWRSVAVEARAEKWSTEASRIVRQCADLVIPITSERKPTVKDITEAVEKLQVA